MNNSIALPLFNQKTDKADRVTSVPLYSVRLVREASISYVHAPISSSSSAYDFFCKIGLPDKASEEFLCLYLNTKNKIIGVEMISRGTLNASLVHPREVFKGALLANANSIMLAHNHPSGDPTPSEPDRNVTDLLVRSGKILDVPVLDHLVVADTDYYSFREAGQI